jgi:hypothetical protein
MQAYAEGCCCYICLEPTKQCSPCVCACRVHTRCLDKWRCLHTRNEGICTICRHTYHTHTYYHTINTVLLNFKCITVAVLLLRWWGFRMIATDNAITLLLGLHIVFDYYVKHVKERMCAQH